MPACRDSPNDPSVHAIPKPKKPQRTAALPGPASFLVLGRDVVPNVFFGVPFEPKKPQRTAALPEPASFLVLGRDVVPNAFFGNPFEPKKPQRTAALPEPASFLVLGRDVVPNVFFGVLFEPKKPQRTAALPDMRIPATGQGASCSSFASLESKALRPGGRFGGHQARPQQAAARKARASSRSPKAKPPVISWACHTSSGRDCPRRPRAVLALCPRHRRSAPQSSPRRGLTLPRRWRLPQTGLRRLWTARACVTRHRALVSAKESQ